MGRRFKRFKKRFKGRGVPRGFVHNWGYRGHWKEKKLGKGHWGFAFKATKRTHARAMGPRPGFKVDWAVQGVQRVVKTGKGTYQTVLTGTKRLIRARVSRR